jgi:asparagine synthase (glutamine-hydrolysing)
MSRIAGMVSSDASEAGVLARGLVPGLRSRDDWRHAVLDAAGAALVWTGWREPLTARLGQSIAVVDGVFYNRDELDGVLGEADGANDAHRLLAGVRRFGFEPTLARINGDFSLAVWDGATGELWLARDRFGVKPLYYAGTDGRLAFASRPRPLLGLPGASRSVNRRFAAVFAGAHYRYIDNAPEESPYEQVRQLPAAHWLRWSNGRIATGRYWDLADAPDFTADERELGAQYRALLLDAVRRRVATAPGRPAFTLSGGLDSSSVLSCAVEFTGVPQQAYSTVYADKTYDETDEIRSMLATKVAQWHPVEVGMPDVLALVRAMVEAHDEPVVTATWLSHYVLCGEVTRSGYGTLFGGLGGDELNAGEYEYFFFHFADLRQAGQETQLAHEVESWVKHHDHPIYRKSMPVVENAFQRMVDLQRPGRCLPDAVRMRRYYGTVDPAYFDLERFVPVLDHPFASYLKNRTYQDLFRETAPCCLRAEDRQATAFGLDHVDPFFDHRLAEFMFRVPGHMKIRDGITKRLLRAAMQGILPEETRTRIKKTGWNAPAHAWFSRGESAQALGDLIHSRAFRDRGLYRVDAVRKLFEEHTRIVESGAPAENHMMFFWQLVNVDVWLTQCERGDGAR